MKRPFIILMGSVAFVIIATAFLSPTQPSTNPVPQGIPDSVWAVFEKSCYDCHADEGSGMAKGKLNFDKWDTYAPDKQLAKAQDICKEMQDKKMPPVKYLKTNSDATPTPEEITRVCNWVAQKEK